MIKLRQVFGLYGSGYGSRSISTTLGISRTTIRKYLRIFNENSLSLKELLCKDDTMLFDFFGLAPTAHHSPRLDALSALLPDYAKRLRKRGVTRKTLYSEYIKCYPQGYSYYSFNRFLRAYMASHKSLFKGFVACGPPANNFLKVLMLAGFPQIIPQKVWSFRAWRKSFPKRFGVSAHGESHFPNGLEFPRMAKVVSRMVWSFRAWRKSFPKWFGISCCKNMEINGSA